MTTEQHPTPPQDQPGPAAEQEPPTQEPPAGWGAPPPPPPNRPQWTTKRTVIAIAVAIGIAAAGGGVIYAASGSESADGGRGGPGGGMGGGPMIVGGPAMDSAAQHGQFQNGGVTEISDTSITVESEDGYTGTYAVDDDTSFAPDGSLDDVEKGDQVSVTADVPDDGGPATALSVLENSGDVMGRPNGNGPNRQDPN